MNAVRALTLAALCTLPLAAAAQWMWVDKDGRKVLSDQAPPPGTPPKNILRQPGGRAAPQPAAAEPEAAASKPAVAAASGPKVSTTDKGLEDKRKQAEAAEAEKKKAETEKVAKAQAENCTRAKGAKAEFDSGARISRTNEKGEREFLDDKQRAAEVARLKQIIASDCKTVQ
ncbi:DUF4124 domain-containing protein [Ramlibacter humi]|uniref:DUF4124 domain-containing protein n=1 Tax=Ramlibacter humi TaxID=2530451 RepID=A0A4Z0CD72_9BURK|nr:DUF4124 domain-containing protein [Ramlibacter humi]TFZ08245.1 DUF4124 domain-containing protein [Ramlibacter humi]